MIFKGFHRPEVERSKYQMNKIVPFNVTGSHFLRATSQAKWKQKYEKGNKIIFFSF